MAMQMQTVQIDAAKYADHDDCLAAAAREYAEQHGLKGWDLSPRYEDDANRETILLDVPTRTVAEQVRALRPDLPADEIAAVLTADSTLDAQGVIESLSEAREEHAANQTHEARQALREGVSRAEVDRLYPYHRLDR